MYSPEKLQAEKRNVLQRLATKHDIKGTLKSKVIISRLLKKFPEGVPKLSAKKPFPFGTRRRSTPSPIKEEKPASPRTVASTRSMGDRLPSGRTRSGRTSWARVERSTPKAEDASTARSERAGKRKREEEEEEDAAAPVAGPSTQPSDVRRSSTLSSDDEPRPIKRIRLQDGDVAGHVSLDIHSDRAGKGKRKQDEETTATLVAGSSTQPSGATESSTLSSDGPGPANRTPSQDADILDRVSLGIASERAGKRKREEEAPVAGPSTLPSEDAPRVTKRVRVASPVNETAHANEEVGRRLRQREPTPAPEVSVEALASPSDERAAEQMLSHPRPFFKPARHLPVPVGPSSGLIEIDLDLNPDFSEDLMSPPLSPVTQSMRDFLPSK
ncbi:hypothetical protein EVG20_g10695 [Dentipellis fragilis]|uniref:Uncharacterized protein n=1 Tax=Dentipellis fragilis TaxID=205917 RepID=A0A4Y9XPT6_9AGAM|nr:hypothetical protein EVG20_g10695 [Dentipellis fragilis]